jgi:radical SAM superfamily enzyme YgiQ (UPF0313 family)
VADFIDMFVIGEGEEVINELLDTVLAGKRNGLGRKEILFQTAGIPAYMSLRCIRSITGRTGLFLRSLRCAKECRQR